MPRFTSMLERGRALLHAVAHGSPPSARRARHRSTDWRICSIRGNHSLSQMSKQAHLVFLAYPWENSGLINGGLP